MKRKSILLIISFVAIMVVGSWAQKPRVMMFYNLENLFDTLRDPDIYDEEFTTLGAKAWNSAKYTKKLGNIEQVLYDVAARHKEFPAVIGVSAI